jgi:hypothetical protein
MQESSDWLWTRILGLIPRSGSRWTKMDDGSRGAIACDRAPIIDRSSENGYDQKNESKSPSLESRFYLSGNEGENVGEDPDCDASTRLHRTINFSLLASGPASGVSRSGRVSFLDYLSLG